MRKLMMYALGQKKCLQTPWQPSGCWNAREVLKYPILCKADWQPAHSLIVLFWLNISLKDPLVLFIQMSISDYWLFLHRKKKNHKPVERRRKIFLKRVFSFHVLEKCIDQVTHINYLACVLQINYMLFFLTKCSVTYLINYLEVSAFLYAINCVLNYLFPVWNTVH